jgi:hypothetical protein
MKKLFAAMMTVLAMLAATPAMATVSAAEPDSVVKALIKMGYKAELTKGDDGTPSIESASSGTTFIIFFLGCTNGKGCATLQFFTGFSKPANASLLAMNQWNKENRFGRGYLADNGSARLEMDVDLDDGGMSDALFEDNVQFWLAVMGKFEKYIRTN